MLLGSGGFYGGRAQVQVSVIKVKSMVQNISRYYLEEESNLLELQKGLQKHL